METIQRPKPIASRHFSRTSNNIHGPGKRSIYKTSRRAPREKTETHYVRRKYGTPPIGMREWDGISQHQPHIHFGFFFLILFMRYWEIVVGMKCVCAVCSVYVATHKLASSLLRAYCVNKHRELIAVCLSARTSHNSAPSAEDGIHQIVW